MPIAHTISAQPPHTPLPSHVAKPLLLLALLIAIAYTPAYFAGFIWDDPDYVTQNLLLHDLTGLYRIWFSPTSSPQYYPLVFTTFWVEYQLWQLNPAGYHITNVLLHIATTVALFFLLRRIGFPAPWLAAALFALHPVQVESVAWITERKNTLSGLFYFLSALAYLHAIGYQQATSGGRLGGKSSAPAQTSTSSFRPLFYALALLCFVAALASKSVTASLPAAIILLLWATHSLSRSRLLLLIPFFALGLVVGLHTAHLERTHVGAVGPEWDFTFLERCFIASRALWFYLWCNLVPVNLMFIYPRVTPPASFAQASAADIALLLSAIALPLMLLLGLRKFGRFPLACTLFFGGTLFPALGFFNVYPHRYSFVADHFQHLAMLGVMLPLALLLSPSFFQHLLPLRPARLSKFIAPLLIAALSVLTFNQTLIYKDNLTLWQDNVARNPGSWMSHINLALALTERAGLPSTPAAQVFQLKEQAFSHVLRARELAPDLPETHWNTGVGLAERNRFDEAQAAFNAALAIDPNYAPAHNSLGTMYANQSRFTEALPHFARAVELQPGFARAQFNYARALDRTGNLPASLAHYAAAVNLTPNDPSYRYRLGIALLRSNIPSDAAGHLNAAVQIRPNFAEARYALSLALDQISLPAQAAQQRLAAQRLLPDVEARVRTELNP